MNDETILIKYYKDVFESKEYKRICSINWQENEQNSKIRKARILIAIIYYYNCYKYFYGLVSP